MFSKLRYFILLIVLRIKVLHALLRIEGIQEVVSLTFRYFFCSGLLGKRASLVLSQLIAEEVTTCQFPLDLFGESAGRMDLLLVRMRVVLPAICCRALAGSD